VNSPVIGKRSNPAKAAILKIAAYGALLLLLMWPAIYNGQPLFSPDTSAYVRGFDAGVSWLSGRTSAWTTWAANLHGQALDNPTSERAHSFQSPEFIIAGRSTAYGALLYIGELLGGLWASILAQAVLSLIAVSLTLKHFSSVSWLKLLFFVGALALASSLPFVVSFLLPDVFAGLSILAAANLISLAHRMKNWERLFWVSLLVSAVVFHPTHLAIVTVLLSAALIARLFTATISSVGIIALGLAVGIGFASEIGFAMVVEKSLGARVTRPPVLMARVIADGTGARYLREKCPQADFAVCQFTDRLLTNSDAFLWETSPDAGIYSPAPLDKRMQLGIEQYRFAAAVLAYDPMGQIIGWAKDAFAQLTMVGLSDFLAVSDETISNLPSAHAERWAQTVVGEKKFPIAIFSWATVTAAIFALIFTGASLARRWTAIPPELKLFFFVVLFCEISNAVICGALSGPHDRYQARLTWLLPLVGLIVYSETWTRSRDRASEKLRVLVAHARPEWAGAGARIPPSNEHTETKRRIRVKETIGLVPDHPENPDGEPIQLSRDASSST
jgi:hypothetical protein